MIRVGLTGGIGSGKTTVARFFEEKGVPVYYADTEAKKLMQTDPYLKAGIEELFGLDAFLDDGKLNRPFIASKAFKNHNTLTQLNQLVHPAVYKDFEMWCSKQKTEYVIKEAAILFENGGYKECDFTILVTAPKEQRIQRVQKRDKSTRDQIIERMSAQWDDIQKIALSDCVISNIDLERTQLDVHRVHVHIKRRIAQGWI